MYRFVNHPLAKANRWKPLLTHTEYVCTCSDVPHSTGKCFKLCRRKVYQVFNNSGNFNPTSSVLKNCRADAIAGLLADGSSSSNVGRARWPPQNSPSFRGQHQPYIRILLPIYKLASWLPEPRPYCWKLPTIEYHGNCTLTAFLSVIAVYKTGNKSDRTKKN